MNIVDFVVNLEIEPESVEQVFDVEVADARPGEEAPCRHFRMAVVPSPIHGGQPKIVAMLVFSTDPDLERRRRRFVLLQPGRVFSGEAAESARWIDTTMMGPGAPISLYEFPAPPPLPNALLRFGQSVVETPPSPLGDPGVEK